VILQSLGKFFKIKFFFSLPGEVFLPYDQLLTHDQYMALGNLGHDQYMALYKFYEISKGHVLVMT
jgi:hypothetical protein